MKAVLPLSLIFALGTYAPAAEQARTSDRVPQQRIRLKLSADGSVARVEKAEKKEAPDEVVMMEKMYVMESMLPMGPRKETAEEPKKFSLLLGGPLHQGKIGSLPFAVGIWPWADILADDAKFKPAKKHVEFDFLRIKW